MNGYVRRRYAWQSGEKANGRVTRLFKGDLVPSWLFRTHYEIMAHDEALASE
jgi:hypothetical protein